MQAQDSRMTNLFFSRRPLYVRDDEQEEDEEAQQPFCHLKKATKKAMLRLKELGCKKCMLLEIEGANFLDFCRYHLREKNGALFLTCAFCQCCQLYWIIVRVGNTALSCSCILQT